MGKPILCLDFDGVLHSYSSGWKGAHVIPDEPHPDAFQFIRDAAEHFEIHVFSSRSKSLRGRWAMQAWMRDLLGSYPASDYDKYDFLYEEIRYPWFKPPALVTIDDRAICFTGTFPTIAELKAFKPWNKRAREAPEARATAQSNLSAEGAQQIDEVNRKPTEPNTSKYSPNQHHPSPSASAGGDGEEHQS